MSGEDQMKPAAPITRASELSLENGDVLTTPLLPGLEMPLSTIFEN